MEKAKGIEEVIDISLEEHNVETLNTYLLSIQENSEALSQETLSTLLKLVKRNGKREDKVLHITCVLSCFQHFLEVDIDSDKWQPFAEGVSKLCEMVFTISAVFLRDEELMKKLCSIVADMVERADCMTDPLVRYMLEILLATAPTPGLSIATQLLILFTASSMLQKASRQIRWEILSREAILSHLLVLSNFLLVSGDYETQVSVMEVLARCRMFVSGQPLLLFTDHPRAQVLFENYKFLNFDPECRLFLNDVNNGMGDKRLVYSVSCMVVTSEKSRFKKPNDPSYSEFWIDFNLGTRSLSFYHSSAPEEPWELMKVNEEVVVCVLAKNSACKARSGEIVAAVKMELILMTDRNNQQFPKLVKLYLRKSRDFEKMEKIIIHNIFRDKYKSEITYTDLLQPNPSISQPIRSDKSGKVEIHSGKYKCLQILKTQEKLLPPVFNSNDVKRVQSYSFTEMESVRHNQLDDERESEDLGIVQPTPPQPTTTPLQLNRTETSAQKPKTELSVICSSGESEDDSKNFNSFTRYIKEQKEQEALQRVVVNDNLLKDVEKEIEEKGSEKFVLKHKELEQELEEINDELENNSRDKPGIETENDLNSNIKKNPDNPKPGSPEVRRSQSAGENRVLDNSNSDDKRLSVTSRKRRLYSNENNNTKDMVFSSQEVLSVEVPAYKLRKQVPTREPLKNNDGKNTSCLQVTCRKKAKGGDVHSDNIFLDLNKSDQKCSDVDECGKVTEKNNEASPPLKYLKKKVNDKLLDPEKSPEDIKLRSDIYSIYSLNSNFSPLKRTYSKPRPKKAKRVRVILSSDSDSDHVPPENSSSKRVTSRKANKTRPKEVHSKMSTFVQKVTKNRVDPTREVKVVDEKDLKPMVLEDPETEPRRESPTALVVGKRGLKGKKGNGGSKKVVQKKVSTNKGRKPVQTRQLRGGKVVGFAEDRDEEECLEIVNYKLPETDTPEDEDFSLDILNRPVHQEKTTLLQSVYKMNELVQFSRNCLKEADSRLQKHRSLTQREREINYAAFDYKVQAKYASTTNQCQKLDAVSKNLVKVKTLLDSTYNLQKDITAQIKADVAEIEEARQEFIKNNTNIDKTESSNIASVFQAMGKGLTNLVYSFFQKNTAKKALPN